MPQDTKYNGWTNYETWLCNLHFDNFWQEEAQNYYDQAEADETFTKEERAALDLSEAIKESVTEIVDETKCAENGFVSDIINATLSAINYYEIAKGYIEGVDKEEAAA